MKHLPKSTIHRRPKRFFTLFAKPSQKPSDIQKFAPAPKPKRPRFAFPKPNLSTVWKLIKQSEITFIIAVALMLFFVFVFLHYFFMITKIEVIDKNGQQVNGLHLLGLENVRGKNMFLTTDTEIETIVRSANPSIETVQAYKQFPQTISLVIRFQKPSAFLSAGKTRFYELASDGTILKYLYERPENLGEIRYYQSLAATDLVLGKLVGSRDVQFAAGIGAILQKHGFSESIIEIHDTRLIMVDTGDFSIKAAAESDMPKQLNSLDQLLRIIQKGGERIKSADIRFDKIIIEK